MKQTQLKMSKLAFLTEALNTEAGTPEMNIVSLASPRSKSNGSPTPESPKKRKSLVGIGLLKFTCNYLYNYHRLKRILHHLTTFDLICILKLDELMCRKRLPS